MAFRPVSLKVRALQWLAQREHSRNELRDKLLHLLKRETALYRAQEQDDAACCEPAAASPPTDPQVEVEALLQWLEAQGHLSTSRFVESRVHARQSRYGNQRIRQELKQHGVALDDETRLALQQSEYDRACEVWRKRYGTSADDASARMRQMRFLVGRGFSMDVVRRVVRQGAETAEGPANDGR